MWEFLTGATMQRLVVIATISYILSTTGMEWDDSRFWCIIVLLMVLEHLAHTDGMQKATENLLTMSRNKLLKLKDFMDGLSRGEERTGDELIEILKKEEHNADE